MSRIYFHEEKGGSEVRGSERAYMGNLCNDLFTMALNVDYFDSERDPSPLRNIIAPSHYCLRSSGAQFSQSLKTALHVHMADPLIVVDGKKVDTFSAALNTAYVMGSDAVKLMARLHGQCEIHAYIEGENREWVAGIIEQGREQGIMRADQGWEETIEMLRSNDQRPVVTSYSVCEQFPNASVSNWEPPMVDGEPDWDAYYDLPKEERWEVGMTALRERELLEIKPNNWYAYYFRDGLNGFKLLETAYALQAKVD